MDRETYELLSMVIYVMAMVVAVAIAVYLFWSISKKSPRGTLLAISIVLMALGYGITLVRPDAIETPADFGMVNQNLKIGWACILVGFIGSLLGVFDLFSKRRSKNTK